MVHWRKFLYDRNEKYYIMSPGGVATTTLIEHIRSFRIINCPYDTDLLKHDLKLLMKLKNAKVIYVYGEHQKIISSLKRRNYFDINCAKIGIFKFSTSNNDKLFKKMCEEVLQNTKNKNHVLCVSYEDLWDSTSEISKFLDLEGTDFEETFPAKRRRESDNG